MALPFDLVQSFLLLGSLFHLLGRNSTEMVLHSHAQCGFFFAFLLGALGFELRTS
jgi:hypothetical protein